MTHHRIEVHHVVISEGARYDAGDSWWSDVRGTSGLDTHSDEMNCNALSRPQDALTTQEGANQTQPARRLPEVSHGR